MVENLITEMFGKSLYSIEYDDLQRYFDIERDENHLLEFKSGEIERKKILKVITSFLNTDGGILILGTPKESLITSSNSKKICVGELTDVVAFTNKLQLSQYIGSNIVPSPINIKIQQVNNQETKCFIIVVEKSSFPPHLDLSSNQYFIRLDTESKPAPHGIIEALFQKRRKPNLRFLYENNYNLEKEFKLNIINDSDYIAEEIYCDFNFNGISIVNYEVNNINQQLRFNNDKFSFHDKIYPLLPKGMLIPIHLSYKTSNNQFIIEIRCWCKESEIMNLYIYYDNNGKTIIYNSKQDDLEQLEFYQFHKNKYIKN